VVDGLTPAKLRLTPLRACGLRPVSPLPRSWNRRQTDPRLFRTVLFEKIRHAVGLAGGVCEGRNRDTHVDGNRDRVRKLSTPPLYPPAQIPEPLIIVISQSASLYLRTMYSPSTHTHTARARQRNFCQMSRSCGQITTPPRPPRHRPPSYVAPTSVVISMNSNEAHYYLCSTTPSAH
jgi:hypothetical protein